MANALYELAQNHKIQDKLREEINHECAKSGGAVTYDNIKEMDYLDKVFKGTSFEEKEKEAVNVLLSVNTTVLTTEEYINHSL